MKKTTVPAHLSADSAAWFQRLTRAYVFEAHQLRLLQVAAEAWDRKEAARLALAAEGIVTRDRFGSLKAHPAVAIERDSRTAFIRAVRELALGEDETPENRPPRLAGYAGR